MGKYGYDGPKQYQPISAWGYVRYSILFAIPVIGFIFWLVCIFSDKNINRRSYARSYLCWIPVVILILILALVVGTSIGIRFGESNTLSRIRHEVSDMLGGRSEGSDVGPSSTRSAGAERAKAAEAPTEMPAEMPTADPTETPTAVPTEAPTAAPTQIRSPAGVTPSFKAAMDSYEDFFNEYIAFMNDYDDSDAGSVIRLAGYLAKYADLMEKLAAIEDEDLSDADMAYYLEVTTRIYAKLDMYD